MPDSPMRLTVTTILLAMLGNGGLACACAMISADVPQHAHHAAAAMTADSSGEAHCKQPCSGHSVSAVNNQSVAAADGQPDKPFPPSAGVHVIDGFAIVRRGSWLQRKQHPPLPLSTPVSRSDTMLD